MANMYLYRRPTDIQNGATISNGNFSQLFPNTEIMAGLTLTITGGNFTNVKRQPHWTVTGGNWTQIDLCSHLHPELVDRHGYPSCAADCRHLVGTDTVVIDGVTVETARYYEDGRV